MDYVELRQMADAIDAHLTLRLVQPAEQPRGEPVAYRYALESGKWTVFISKARARYLAEHGAEADPLYSAQPKPEQAVGDGVKPSAWLYTWHDPLHDAELTVAADACEERARKRAAEVGAVVEPLYKQSPAVATAGDGDGVTIKRYDVEYMPRIFGDGVKRDGATMREHPQGVYVTYCDHLAALASRPVEAVATVAEVTVKSIMEIVEGVIRDHGGEDLDDEDVRHSFDACLRERLEAALAHLRPTGVTDDSLDAENNDLSADNYRLHSRIGELEAELERLTALAQPRPMGGVPDVEAMTRRFLSWRLPDAFAPDCGISFKPLTNPPGMQPPLWPTGTNLFAYEQAKAMFEYVLAAAPEVGQNNEN